MPSSLKETGHHGAFFVRVTLKGQSLQRDRHRQADRSKPDQELPLPRPHGAFFTGEGVRGRTEW